MKKVIAILFGILIIYLMFLDKMFLYTFIFIICAMGLGYLLHGGSGDKK